MRRTSRDTPDLLSGLDSGATVLNNARVVRDAQRADHDLEPPSGGDWRQALRPRLALVGALVLFWALGIIARLIYLQVFQYEALVLRAERQQSQTIDINPRRGPILDRFGRLLAYSVDGDVIYAVPSDVKDPEALAAALCGALEHCDADERKALVQRLDSRRGRSTVLSTLSPEEADGIAALKQDGFVVDRGTGGRTGSLKVVTRELKNTEELAALICEKLSRCNDDPSSRFG